MAINVNGFFPGELKPSTTVAGCVEVFENVWPNPYDTIKMLENECANPLSGVYWERAGTLGQGPYQDARTNLLCGITEQANIANNGVAQNIHNQFNMLLLATTITYAKRYGITEPLWHESYQMLRYGEGQEYKAHYDGGSTQVSRQISCICYLNDDYQGGELEFVNFKVKIKPESGMLILFPSSFPYTHIAHPVTKWTKYSLVTWLRDK
jgi:predicted 2-oxoglutarate/Fe(II)-dependent dioxygenase YbiX